MLPDFLKVKARLETMLEYEMELARLAHMGVFADVPTSIVVEGNNTVIIREDGSVEKVELKEARVEQEIKFAEVEEMTHEMVLHTIDEVAKEMAEQIERSIYEELNRITDETGNVISDDGKPFSIEMLFEMLEKMDLDFDEAGNPSGTRFVPPPKLPAADPETARRYQALMDQKREEWRVRENNRKLVG